MGVAGGQVQSDAGRSDQFAVDGFQLLFVEHVGSGW